MALVLVSPCLCEGNYGGVQLSGRIIRDRLHHEMGAEEFACLCYGAYPQISHESTCTASKLEMARRARKIGTRCETVLFWHLSMLKLLPMLRRRNTRVLLFLHGVECWRRLPIVTDHLLKSVDTFLTNSSFTWSRFIAENPRWKTSRHRVVALGAGTAGSALRPPATLPAALMVGRLEPGEGYKGHAEVIRSWPRVMQTVCDAELWIAGAGGLETELKRIAVEAGVSSRVRFFGRVTDAEKERLIEDARCLVLPSKGEGFGLAYLEAMRCGRPCLVSNADAGREVVNPPESGLAVDPDDAGALSQAIIRLMANGPEWNVWSARARARYESHFTSRHFEDRMLAALPVNPRSLTQVGGRIA